MPPKKKIVRAKSGMTIRVKYASHDNSTATFPLALIAIRHLRRCDPKLAKIISAVGSYEIKTRSRPFEALVESIIYQQLAGAAADAILKRFVQLYAGKFPTPDQLTSTKDELLRSVGLSARKIGYLKDLAGRIIAGSLRLDLFDGISDEQVVDQLVQVKGIGKWTAEMFMIFCLGRADVLPVGDLGLRKAIQRAYCIEELPDAKAIYKIAEKWKPYRSFATWYMWKSLAKFKGIG